MKTFNNALTSAAVGLTAAASLPGVVDAATVPPSYFSAYHFSGGEGELEELRQELDRVANQFSEIVRPIARQKLRHRIGPYSQVELARGDDAPVLTLGTQNPVVCDGRWHQVTNERREEGQLSCSFEGEGLRVETKYDKGTRSEQVDFGAQGEMVRIQSVVRSPKLPDDIRFQLSYQAS